MGLPTAPSPDSATLRICIPREARALLALWMAAQSTPKAAAWLRARTLGQSSDGRTASGPQGSGLGAPSRLTLGSDVFITEWPWQEAAYAVELLDRPPDEVASVLHPNWQRWSQPGTPTVELAKALGLPAPDAAPPEGATGSQVYGNADCDNGGASHAQS